MGLSGSCPSPLVAVHATLALAEDEGGPPPAALVRLDDWSSAPAGQQVQLSLSIDVTGANAAGQVVVTAVQTSSSAPTGASCVARLNFETVATGVTKTAPGGAMSLSSAFQSCSGVLADPVLLPARAAGGLEFQIVGAIPTLGGPGLNV